MKELYVLQTVAAPFVQICLHSPVYLVGRSAGCDLVIRHPTVSRKHAKLQVEPEGVRVVDLGSRNGTYLGKQRVTAAPLVADQVVRFGDVAFRLVVQTPDPIAQQEEETDSGPGEALHEPAQGTPARPAGLSGAQCRVFNLLRGGYSEKQIAGRLNLSAYTVHNHVRAIYLAFKVHSRSQLLALVLGNNGGGGRTGD